MKPEDSTASHAEHKGLVDSTVFTGKDYSGKVRQVSLRDSGGNMGVHSVGGRHRIKVHDNKNDVEVVSDEYLFKSEADALNFVDRQQRDMKSMVVTESRPQASVDELQRRHNQQVRHAEENKLREGRTSSGPYLEDGR